MEIGYDQDQVEPPEKRPLVKKGKLKVDPPKPEESKLDLKGKNS